MNRKKPAPGVPNDKDLVRPNLYFFAFVFPKDKVPQAGDLSITSSHTLHRREYQGAKLDLQALDRPPGGGNEADNVEPVIFPNAQFEIVFRDLNSNMDGDQAEIDKRLQDILREKGYEACVHYQLCCVTAS